MSKFNVAGGKTYNLNASISSTATTITLSSFAEPVSGTLYTMALLNTDIAYGTIQPKTSSSEFISFTGITQNVDGTATLTGVTRGLAKKYPYTSDSTFKLPHSGQSQFILSDAPQVFNKYPNVDSDVTINGLWTFGQTPVGLNPGAVQDASTTVKGIAKASVAPSSSTNPIFVGDNDGRVPTQAENDALAGTSGVPSSTDPFVTNNDSSSAIDQSQTTQNGSTKVGETNATGKQNKLAQSFIANKTLTTGVMLNKQADTGSFTGTVTVSLQADTAGSPSGVALATVTLSNATWLAIPAGEFGAIFSASYATVDGTTYWIVIENSTADNANHPNLGTNTAGGYASGSVKYNNTTDGWVAIATIDLYFKTLQSVAFRVMRASSTGFSPAFPVYAADAGTTDAYYITVPGCASYVIGQTFVFLATTANTGAATLNVNSLGAVTIKKQKSTDLSTGDILAGQILVVSYDGTNFQMQSQISNTLVTYKNGTTTKDASDASTTQNIPHGLGVTPKKIQIDSWVLTVSATANSMNIANTVYNGTTQSSFSVYNSNGGTYVSGTSFTLNTSNTTGTQTGVVTFDATNIIITWTKTGSPTGTYTLLWQAEA